MKKEIKLHELRKYIPRRSFKRGLNSSSLKSCELSEDGLYLEFKAGQRYFYKDFKRKDYEDFMNAKSKGMHFNIHIKNKFDFKRLD